MINKDELYNFRLRIDKNDSNIYLFIDGNFDGHLNEAIITSVFYNNLYEKFSTFFNYSELNRSHISLFHKNETLAFLNYLIHILSRKYEFREIPKSCVFIFKNYNIFHLLKFIDNIISNKINDIKYFKNEIIEIYNKNEIDINILLRIVNNLDIEELKFLNQAKDFDLI